MVNRLVLLALAVCMSALGANASRAAGYTFTKVYDQTMAPSGLKYLYYSLSNGTAAVTGPYDSQTKSGLFTGTGGPLNTVVKSGDPAPVGTFASAQFAISGASGGAGQFAFSGLYTGGGGLFRSAGGVLTSIAKGGDAAPIGTFSGFNQAPDISGGVVAFLGQYGSAGRGIFTGSGGALTSIALRGDASDIGAFTSFNSPVIDADTVGFFAQSATSSGVFTHRAGTLTTVAKLGDAAPNGSAFWNLSNPSIDNGDVVFRGKYTSGQGLFKSDGGGAPTLIVKSGDISPLGTAFVEFGEPKVSNETVAFWAKYAPSTNGIFVANNGSVVNVIKEGDSLFGGTIARLTLESPALDDDGSGRMIFSYELTNGVGGLAIANPVFVPEPSTALLIGLGVMNLLGFQRSRRRRR